MAVREGNLDAPKREAIPWQTPEFTDPAQVDAELERVFDICHGCRRCVSLCNSFPTLFDLVDESDTFEIDGVDKADYRKVVDNCYMCDLCAETKCPYLPPHEWAVDFPHLMLRAKARYFQERKPPLSQRLITSTDPYFRAVAQPGVAALANAVNGSKMTRKLVSKVLGVHQDAPIPDFHSNTARKRLRTKLRSNSSGSDVTGEETRKVAIYVTCYGDTISPQVVEDLVAILEHNGLEAQILRSKHCCGMPKFELGDIESVARRKEQNIGEFLEAVEEGFSLMSVVPSCTLMYRQELPLLFPDDEQVKRVADAFVDPFEFLFRGWRDGWVQSEFKTPLGKVTYHAACHQRVQNIGRTTQRFLELIPETEVTLLERCSGHGGTHAIKNETYDGAMKIARPVTRRLDQSGFDTFGSDCPIAGRLIMHGSDSEQSVEHPISMVRRAYGI